MAIAIIEVADNEEHKKLNDALTHWSRKRLKAEYSYRKTIVLLQPTDTEVANGGEIDDWKSLKQHLKLNLKKDFSCSIGEIYTQPQELCFAYQSSRAVLKVGKRLKPDQRFYHYDNFELPSLFEGSLAKWQRDKLIHCAEQLEQADSALIGTLQSWFEHNCDNKLASSALFIHPNTLRYRLKRVEEICGLDLRRHQDSCRLYFSIIL